jgi:hypothetical protein
MLEVGKYCTSVLLFHSRTVASIFSPLHHLPACLPANWENSPGSKISESLYQWEWGSLAPYPRHSSGSDLVSAGPVLGEATKATICTSRRPPTRFTQGSYRNSIICSGIPSPPENNKDDRAAGESPPEQGTLMCSLCSRPHGCPIPFSPAALPSTPGEMLNADSDLMITQESQLPC